MNPLMAKEPFPFRAALHAAVQQQRIREQYQSMLRELACELAAHSTAWTHLFELCNRISDLQERAPWVKEEQP